MIAVLGQSLVAKYQFYGCEYKAVAADETNRRFLCSSSQSKAARPSLTAVLLSHSPNPLKSKSSVSAILLLGGSASISALTGMDIRAATMLLPVGVIAFVIVGGLRSTFVSDYAHTTIVFVIIWIFVYTARTCLYFILRPQLQLHIE